MILLKIPPKGSVKNNTPLKFSEDSSLTYEEMEDICFRVSKLEDMIKGNAQIDDFVNLEKEMVSKEDIKGMAIKEDLLDLKDFIEDIKHNFIPQFSTTEEDKEEQDDLFQSCLEKIEEKLESRNLDSSKFDDSLQQHKFNSSAIN